MTDGWINVSDPERIAHEKLEPGVLGYFAGGAGDEITLADNLAAWKRWRLRPRVMVDVSAVSTGIELFGAPLSMPIVIAPVAYQRLVHPDGELGMARGAAAAGTAMCLSTLATARPGEVAAAAPGGRRFFQLYEFRDAGITRALMEEAIDQGFEAIVVTADLPPGGNRERDRRNGFHLPAELGIPSVEAAIGDGRSVTVEDTFDLMTLAADWPSLERLASEVERAGPGQGDPHRRGRGAGGRARRRRRRRLQPRRPPARLRAWPPPTSSPRSSTRSPGASRSSSTAASAAAPTSPSPSRSAPTPSSSAGRRSGAWRPGERPASPACWRCCEPSSSWRWRSAAGPRPRDLGRAHVRRAPSASVYSDQ